jgi:hypothetical protein
MTRTFNPQSFELALASCPEGAPAEKVRHLAATIQDAIEDWLAYEQRWLDAKEAAGDQTLP